VNAIFQEAPVVKAAGAARAVPLWAEMVAMAQATLNLEALAGTGARVVMPPPTEATATMATTAGTEGALMCQGAPR